jgi:hypothetical protein
LAAGGADKNAVGPVLPQPIRRIAEKTDYTGFQPEIKFYFPKPRAGIP